MNSKTEQIVIGLIVLLFGVFVAANVSFGFDWGALSFLALGMGFILMYKTKRKNWALVLGVYLAYFGLSLSVLETFPRTGSDLRLFETLAGSLFFAVTGIMFMVFFYDKNKRGLLIPGALFTGVGVNRFLSQTFSVDLLWAELLIHAVCFYIIYRLGNYFLGKWPKYVSVILVAAALSRLLFAH